jgi:hypothetical protein
MSNLPHTFSGGHDSQQLFVPVEVSSPDGNFDIIGKLFLPTVLYDLLNQNFDFGTTKTLILHAWSIF